MISPVQHHSLPFLKPILDLEFKIKIVNNLINKQNYLDLNTDIFALIFSFYQLKELFFNSLQPLEKLQIVRQSNRPTTLDIISSMLQDPLELNGDRNGSNDTALIGGLGMLYKQPVLFIGHQKGKNAQDNIFRNFGMASPGGYRKALRLMKHANTFNLPILSFIDTPGAWAGVNAEKMGQGQAIATNLREIFSLNVPIITTIIGEGGSGGALGIGIADKIFMLEHSIYTVATPEACAAILWKNNRQAFEAAKALKITALDLYCLNIIDKIIYEPIKKYPFNSTEIVKSLKQNIYKELVLLKQLSVQRLKKLRLKKFRTMGFYYSNEV
uniref:Acetyl-coenzyme A carboxylase carboxyl transferase subunit alpha n=1 Tax=Pterocladiophila hemisphaerica TaxID=2712948 RepID=A0A6M3WWR2_9FLOR|nr:accA [Pterocladiophila hemisphaerica]